MKNQENVEKIQKEYCSSQLWLDPVLVIRYIFYWSYGHLYYGSIHMSDPT